MRKLSRPVIAVLVTLMTAILGCLAFAVWMISAPEESAAPSRDFVVSFDLGEDYSKEDEDSTYHARAYSSTEETNVLNFGEGDNAIPDPTWADTTKTFGGWKTSPEDSNVYGSETLKTTVTGAKQTYTVASDVTFTAQWTSTTTETTYTVKFDAPDADGTIPEGGTVNEATYSIPEMEPTRTGYTFEGWYVEDTYSEDVTLYKYDSAHATYDLNGDTTFHAHWKVITYTVQFTDTKFSHSSTGTVSLENAVVSFPSLGEQTGYTFDGWTYAGSTDAVKSFTLDAAYIKAQSLGKDSTITFTAKWTAIEYTIKFVDGGDHSVQTAAPTLSDTQTNVHIGDSITGLTTHTLEGYDFVEWQYTGGTITAAQEGTYTLDEALIGSAENVEGTMTITLTAQWKIKTFTVTFDKNNGTASTTEEIAWHSQVSFSGHEITGDYNDTRYIGWKLSTDTETKPTLYTALGTGDLPTNYTDTYAATTQSVYTVEGEVTFEAQWAQLYTVNLDKNGSSTSIADNVAMQQGFYGQTVPEIPASLNKSVNGKTRTFIGWYHGETTKDDWTFGEYTDTDYAYTLTARWTMTVTLYFHNTFNWSISNVSLYHNGSSYKVDTTGTTPSGSLWTSYSFTDVREDYYEEGLTVKFNTTSSSSFSSTFTNNIALTSEDDMRFIPCYNPAKTGGGYYIDAYDSLSKITEFKVHFYDVLGWDSSTTNIYAYAFFVDGKAREHELLGPFDDKKVETTKDGTTGTDAHWYTVTFVAPTYAENLSDPNTTDALTVIFHNSKPTPVGENTKVNQTVDIKITSSDVWVMPTIVHDADGNDEVEIYTSQTTAMTNEPYGWYMIGKKSTSSSSTLYNTVSWSSSYYDLIKLDKSTSYTLTAHLIIDDYFSFIYRSQGTIGTDHSQPQKFGWWGDSCNMHSYFIDGGVDVARVFVEGDYTFTISGTTQATAAPNAKVSLKINGVSKKIIAFVIHDQIQSINGWELYLHLWTNTGDIDGGWPGLGLASNGLYFNKIYHSTDGKSYTEADGKKYILYDIRAIIGDKETLSMQLHNNSGSKTGDNPVTNGGVYYLYSGWGISKK